MVCKEQSKDNKTYYNYFPYDGKNVANIQRRSTLGNNDEKYCISCGNIVLGYGYCNSCGVLSSKISSQRVSNLDTNSKSKTTNDGILKDNIKNGNINFDISTIDIKSSALSAIMTIAFLTLLVLILNQVLLSSVHDASDSSYLYEGILPSKFKMIISSLVTFNLAKLSLAVKVGIVNAGSLTMALRSIISPLIIILFMFISTNILIKKENIKNNLGLNSAACGIIYAIIMVVIGFMANYSMPMGEYAIKVKVNLFSLFINAFFIAFIGAYLGMSTKVKDNQNIFSYLFRKASIAIILGFVVTTAVSFIFMYFMSNDMYLYIKYGMNGMFSTQDRCLVFVYIFMLVSIIGSWLFAMANFATFSIIGMTKYSLLSLSQETGIYVILLLLIPITLFIFIGRSLKKRYIQDSLVPISIFSGIYAILMGCFGYATTLIMSLKSEFTEVFLDEIIYQITQLFGYYGNCSFISDYMTEICDSITSGIYMGPKVLSLIISSFIFSFIFVYIGYKNKKIENIEGR